MNCYLHDQRKQKSWQAWIEEHEQKKTSPANDDDDRNIAKKIRLKDANLDLKTRERLDYTCGGGI